MNWYAEEKAYYQSKKDEKSTYANDAQAESFQSMHLAIKVMEHLYEIIGGRMGLHSKLQALIM